MKPLFIVALATVAFAVPPMFGGRRKEGFTSHLLENRKVDTSLIDENSFGSGTITQKLDHFDENNKNNWQQRYFFNYQFKQDDSNVNIIYISGEQIASDSTIMGGDYACVSYAKELNSSLYLLEHRFYGDSHPTTDTSIDNLKFLSSRQAIEDIAEFIRQKNEEKEGDQKWIVFGGSYAGNLAAWSRLKHPELIIGAVSSSAPLLAQLDFYGYLQTVDEDFNKHGGLCYQQLVEGFEEARIQFQSAEGRDNLTKLFKIYPPLSHFDDLSTYDIDTFFAYLVAPFTHTAQYNSPSVDDLCQTFTTHGPDYDPLKALRYVNPELTVNANFSHSVDELSGIEFNGDISQRLWTYQTCAEFGFFRSSNRGTNAFGQTQSSNTFIEYCIQLFGINVDQIEKNVESTNAYYGQRDYYAGTNVVFSHGTQDPWAFLTKKDDSKHWSVVIIEVEGGSHTSDIGISCDALPFFCTENMKYVQKLTLENMQRWIDPVFPVPDRVDITDNVGKRPQFFDPNVVPSFSPKIKIPEAVKIRGELLKVSDRYGKISKFTGKGRKVLLPPPIPSEDDVVSESIIQDWIEQTWDHFNMTEDRTFKQKFWFNNKFGSTEGPNFLMIGGEGPEDVYWVQTETLDWIKNAKSVGANVFLLEHRYYGESKLGTNDLQYLTSAQMLYDVATFIRTQQVKQKLTGPWITFGGSYPGALAAWSREWFPELILGAVGSSGPVLAKNDFYEYLEGVEDVIKRHSQKCYDRTNEAFAKLRTLSMEPEGRELISDKFSLSPAWSQDDVIDSLDLNEVFMELFGLYMGTVQYNSLNWSKVANLCAPMEDDKYEDVLDALREVQIAQEGENATTISSFKHDIDYLISMKEYIDGHDSTQFDDDELSDILWTWQTCNEFGYYQTTDYGEGIFGTPVPVNYFVMMCEQVYGVGMDQLEKGIARTNYRYGGRARYNTTNVVLLNGDADPWHALGIIEQGNLDESVVPILIKGTSNCADMYGTNKNDPPELTAARQTIQENIKRWLAPPRRSTPSPMEITTQRTERGKPTTAVTTPSLIVASSTTTTTTLTPTTSTALSSSNFFVAFISLLYILL